MKKFIKGFLLVLLIAVVVFGTKVVIEMAVANRKAALDTDRTQLTKKNDLLVGYQEDIEEAEIAVSNYSLSVPIFNQLSDPPLEFGCEVTALSMLLSYYEYDYDKNKLAEMINKEPYQDKEGLFGNPDLGFVGDMTGEKSGMSVNVEPIYELSKEIVTEPYEVINSTGSDLDSLLDVIQTGSPVWVIVTTDYKTPKSTDFIDWETRNGMKKILPNHHAAVISGFDSENVFLSDPYGTVKTVEKNQLSDIIDAMGRQSLYIK